MDLAEKGITANRSIKLKTFTEKGLEKAGELALQNCKDLLKILEWNKEKGIEVFRISSQLFPWGTEYNLEDLPNWEFILPVMKRTGKFISQNNMRVSFHPGPYNNLGSPDRGVIENSLKDLEMHSKIMDYLDQPQSRWAKINIHLGGSYGDKEATIKRFVQNFKYCSEGLSSRLTLENDDRESLYSVGDLYKVYESTGVPIVFDGHHWQVGAKSGTYVEDMLKAYSTWGDVVPTLHWSNSRKEWEDPTAKINAHTDWYYVTMRLPIEKRCDIILESKAKERALLKYMEGLA